MASLTISGLAREGGVSVETVRYYQRRNLLEKPERSGASALGGGIRRYGGGHVQRLRFIRAAQAAGFTLDQIGELLLLDATDDRSRVRALALQQLNVLDLKIAQLEKARAALGKLAQECGSRGQGPCPILQSFEDASDRSAVRIPTSDHPAGEKKPRQP